MNLKMQLTKALNKSIAKTLNTMKIKGAASIKDDLKNYDTDVQATVKGNNICFAITQNQPKQLDKKNKAVQALQKTLGNVPIEMLNQETQKEIPKTALNKALDNIIKQTQKVLGKNL